MVACVQDSLQLQAYQWWVEWDHIWGNWGLNILVVEEGLKVGSKSLYCGDHWVTGWAQEAPKVRGCSFSRQGGWVQAAQAALWQAWWKARWAAKAGPA